MSAELLAGLEAAARNVVAASLVGAAIGVVASLLRRPLRALPAGIQAGLWWLVALRLLLQLGGAPALELAWLPGTAPSASRSAAPALSPRATSMPISLRPASAAEPTEAQPWTPATHPAAGRANPPVPLRNLLWRLLGAIWLTGALAATGRLAWSLAARRRLLREAQPVDEPEVLAELDRARRLARLESRIALCRSPSVPTPLVTGFLRPTVVLPSGARLGGDDLRLALLHELVHVRRRDAWWALVPALTRRLLFFHPAAHAAEREFALATEAACDREALRLAGSPVDRYGALLLRFALVPRQAARIAAAWPLASPVIHRRLDMLTRHPRRSRPLGLVSLAVTLVGVVLALPVRLVAAPSPPTPPAEPTAPAAPAPGTRWAPALDPMPALPAPPALPSSPALPALPAPAALAPLAPMAPITPLAPPELQGADWLVLVDGDARLSLQAPRNAQRRASELAARERRPVALIGRDGTTYLVRDEPAVEALGELFFAAADGARAAADRLRQRAEVEMEAEQRKLEEQHLEMADFGTDERRLAADLERATRFEAARLADLQRELARLSSGAADAALARAHAAARELEGLEEELAKLRADTDRRREEARAERQRALEHVARERGEIRDQLAAERSELRRQLEAQRGELERELGRQIDRIFENGLAVPLER